jgi:hypothetical protein
MQEESSASSFLMPSTCAPQMTLSVIAKLFPIPLFSPGVVVEEVAAALFPL